ESQPSKESEDSAFSSATSLYAVFLIVFLLIEETSLMSPSESAQEFKISSVFAFYMYTVGIGFFIYVHFFVIHTAWINRVLYWW
ncbi:hypothetical protein PMAYCL1PPCAC_01670, partial [Pristionchus mayeri]